MKKIIIRHGQGSKSNQTEVFELPIKEIVFGRDGSCQVRFDPNQDEYVSSVHCKITVQNENQFLLTDLGSSNGTFVNGVLIGSKQSKQQEPVPLQAKDTIQLGGVNGASFVFDLARTTPSTKIIELPIGEFDGTSPTKSVSASKASEKPVRAKFKLNKKIINTVAALMAVAVGAYAYFTSSYNPASIHKKFSNSTVLIEMSWKLIHTPTGKQLFQKFDCITEKNKCVTDKLPLYVSIDGVVEPLLTPDDGKPIGGAGSGSGFVVHEGGHIITNRHVATPWQTNQSVDLPLPGILLVCNDNECSAPKIDKLPNDPDNKYVAALKKWVPAKTKTLGAKPLRGKIVDGRYDYMEVTFPATNLRIPAHLGPTSGNADVALIKIDTTKKLQAVQIDTAAQIVAGDTVTVMGYPTISPETARKNEAGEWLTIPDVTVTTGQIGRVLAAKDKTDNSDEWNEMGDMYQLTVNATGPGNSGGPVFNDKGRVIGIFTSKRVDETGTTISFAVPIKYGQELM